jgi:hypothetical protein
MRTSRQERIPHRPKSNLGEVTRGPGALLAAVCRRYPLAAGGLVFGHTLLGCSRSELIDEWPSTSSDGGQSGSSGAAPSTSEGGTDDGSSMAIDASDEGAGGPDQMLPDLPSTAACLAGGNVLWLEGDPDSWWGFAGTQTFSTGTFWLGYADNIYAKYDGTTVSIGVPGSVPGGEWQFAFSTWSVAGISVPGPLQTGVVYSVTPSNYAEDLTIYSPTAQGCGIGGAFRLDAFSAQSGLGGDTEDTLLTLTATFSASCPHAEGKTGILRGCLHYDSTNPNP